MTKKILFIAIFFNCPLKGKLEVKCQQGGFHSTLCFKPTEGEISALSAMFGKRVECKVTGYGNNGENEGLLLRFSPDIPFFGKVRHLTLSYAKSAQPSKTADLNFAKDIPADIPKILTGEIKPFYK